MGLRGGDQGREPSSQGQGHGMERVRLGARETGPRAERPRENTADGVLEGGDSAEVDQGTGSTGSSEPLTEHSPVWSPR